MSRSDAVNPEGFRKAPKSDDEIVDPARLEFKAPPISPRSMGSHKKEYMSNNSC
jgi:hypothetical protein